MKVRKNVEKVLNQGSGQVDQSPYTKAVVPSLVRLHTRVNQ